MVSRGVEGCRVGRVGMGCRGVESVSRFGVEVSRPGLSLSHSISFDLIQSRVDLTKNPAKLGVYLGTTDLYTLPHWVPCACRHSPLLPAVHCSRPRESLHGTAVSAVGVIFCSITRPVSSLCDEASVGFFAATGAAKATRLIRTGASQQQLWCQRRRAGAARQLEIRTWIFGSSVGAKAADRYILPCDAGYQFRGARGWGRG